jgi:hypothetical protein
MSKHGMNPILSLTPRFSGVPQRAEVPLTVLTVFRPLEIGEM